LTKAPRFSFPLPAGDVLERVPLRLAMLFKVLPIRATATTLTVVCSDPSNHKMIERLEKHSGLRVDARKVAPSEIDEALKFVYASQALEEGPASISGKFGSSPAGDESTSGELAGLGANLPDRGSASGDPWYDGYSESEASADGKPVGRTSISGKPLPPKGKRKSRTSGSKDGGIAPFIERGQADGASSDSSGEHEADIRDLREDHTESDKAVALIDQMLTEAVRMGASEIFVDGLTDRLPCRARVGNRLATVMDIERNQAGDALARLRAMAHAGEPSEHGCDAGRIDFRLGPGEEVDLFLRTFPGHQFECHVLDVIRHPASKIRTVPPRGLSPGSPAKLRELLGGRLRDRKLGAKVARQLTGPPGMIAVAAPRHRPRESMLAMLASAVSGPTLGLRTLYVGERPRFYLEDHNVVVLPTTFHTYKETLPIASRMSADYLLIEQCFDYHDLLTAMYASASQHVIVGIAASDPTDVLLNLTSAPETRRLAHRLGAILFLDSTTMKVVEMTQPLRDAVATLEGSGSVRQMVEQQVEEGAPLLGQSMEVRSSDVFTRRPAAAAHRAAERYSSFFWAASASPSNLRSCTSSRTLPSQ